MPYIDRNGVKFSDDKKTLIELSCGFKGEYVVPDVRTSKRTLAGRYYAYRNAGSKSRQMSIRFYDYDEDELVFDAIMTPSQLRQLGLDIANRYLHENR